MRNPERVTYQRLFFNQLVLIMIAIVISLINVARASNLYFVSHISALPTILSLHVWSKRYLACCKIVAGRRRLKAPLILNRNEAYASCVNINPKRYLCNIDESQKSTYFDIVWPYNDLKKQNLEQYFVGFLDYEGVHELLDNDGEFVIGVEGDKNELDAVLWISRDRDVRKVKLLKCDDKDSKQISFKFEFNSEDVRRSNVGALIRFYVDEKREVVLDVGGSKAILASSKVWTPDRSWYMSSRMFAVNGMMYVHQAIFRGTLKLSSSSIDVIIKCPREGTFRVVTKHLLKESRLARHLNHVNVVKFYGIAVDSFPIMLAMQCGEIDLQKCVRQIDLPMSMKLKFAQDIACGMRHVVSESVLHNDLCVLNCVIFKDANGGLIAKIIDFDLAIDMDRNNKNGFTDLTVLPRIPAPYMSPEALRGFGSEKSDVWQYGLTLWELFTDGCVPYDNCKDETFMKTVMDNGCTLKRANVPTVLNLLIKKCLNFRLFHRPTFDDICQRLPFLLTEIDDVCNRLDQIALGSSIILFAYNTDDGLLYEIVRRSLKVLSSAPQCTEFELKKLVNDLRHRTGKAWLCFVGDQFAISYILFDYYVAYFQIANVKFLFLSTS